MTAAPIDLYFDSTPNGWKISIFLEEAGLPYRIVPIRLSEGAQFTAEFEALSPNGRIPAIVDPDGPCGQPIAVFESGAILLYLAEKHGVFLGRDPAARMQVVQWLMWQMAGLGPMAGQNGHFLLYAPVRIPYAIARYGNEVRRLYTVLDRQLERTGAYVAGDYSIADIACFPWIMTHKKQGLSLDDFPALQRWFARVRARPQVQRGLAAGDGLRPQRPAMDPAIRARLYGLDTKESP
jgi:GST-like protein